MSCVLKNWCKSLNQTLHFGDWHQNAALPEFPGLFRAAFPQGSGTGLAVTWYFISVHGKGAGPFACLLRRWRGCGWSGAGTSPQGWVPAPRHTAVFGVPEPPACSSVTAGTAPYVAAMRHFFSKHFSCVFLVENAGSLN